MIRGAGVGLRHVAHADLPLLERALADRDVFGEFNPSRMTAPRDIRKRFEETGYSSEDFEMLLVLDDRDAVVGHVLHFAARRYSSARELGWMIHDIERRRRGLASAAVGLLVDYLFRSLPVHRLECCASPLNGASVRVAEKNGFVREGVLRGLVFAGGQHIDSVVMSQLRPEWEARRTALGGAALG